MKTPACPKCGGVIPGEDINVGGDLAFCRPCHLAHPFSLLVRGNGIDPKLDLARPPAGAWMRHSALGTIVGATHRSWGGAAGLLAIGVFWNGIVSVFVLVALAATMSHLGWERPEWFPAPEMNQKSMGLGITIFLWIFLTPFIAVGLAMVAGFLLCLGGRTEVRLRDLQGEIFTGIGPIGHKRRFQSEGVKDVRISDQSWTDSDGDRRRKTEIILDRGEEKPIKFGSSLPEARRQFVAAALRQALLRPA